MRTDGGRGSGSADSRFSCEVAEAWDEGDWDYPTPRQVMEAICGSREGGGEGARGVNASSRWVEGEEVRREEELKVRGTCRGTGWESGKVGKCVTVFERAEEEMPKIYETQPNKKKKKMNSESTLGMLTHFSHETCCIPEIPQPGI